MDGTSGMLGVQRDLEFSSHLTSNLHLHTEQFILRKNQGPNEHLLQNQGQKEYIKSGRRDGDKHKESHLQLNHPQRGGMSPRDLDTGCLPWGIERKSCTLKCIQTIKEKAPFAELKHLLFHWGNGCNSLQIKCHFFALVLHTESDSGTMVGVHTTTSGLVKMTSQLPFTPR